MVRGGYVAANGTMHRALLKSRFGCTADRRCEMKLLPVQQAGSYSSDYSRELLPVQQAGSYSRKLLQVQQSGSYSRLLPNSRCNKPGATPESYSRSRLLPRATPGATSRELLLPRATPGATSRELFPRATPGATIKPGRRPTALSAAISAQIAFQRHDHIILKMLKFLNTNT